MATSKEAKKSLKDVAAQADEIKDSLAAFSKSARALSGNRPRMIESYPDQWIAVSDGAVLAHGNTMEAVLAKIEEMGIDRSDIVVRLIEKNLRTLVL